MLKRGDTFVTVVLLAFVDVVADKSIASILDKI